MRNRLAGLSVLALAISATCTMPPPRNTLPIPIDAGEQRETQ